jgi:hypothetical protein
MRRTVVVTSDGPAVLLQAADNLLPLKLRLLRDTSLRPSYRHFRR